MKTLNRVMLIGYVTTEPVVESLSAVFGLATNTKVSTEFHRIKACGVHMIDLVMGGIKKGDGVVIEGRLISESIEIQGQKVSITKVLAENIIRAAKNI